MSAGRVRAAATASIVLLLSAAAQGAADPASLRRGEAIYSRCVACHAVEANRTGPQHCGLFGRRAGTAPGYDTYSEAMKRSGVVWDAKALDRFLKDPMQAVPGTTMGYAGIKDDTERTDLIAWLKAATQPGKACQLSH